MKLVLNKSKQGEEVREDFHWGATITMIFLVLSFLAASFYVLVSSYMDIS
jgi:hypothetical protein